MTTTPELLSVAQASDELGIPIRTLHNHITLGKITAEKVGGRHTSAYVLTRAEVDRIKAQGDAA